MAGALDRPLLGGSRGRATGSGGCLRGTGMTTGGEEGGWGAYMWAEDHVLCLGSSWREAVGGDRGICRTLREGGGVAPGCTGEKAEAREVESCESC